MMKKTPPHIQVAAHETSVPRVENYFANSSYFKFTLIILTFFILGFLIYSNTFQSPFVFDDKVRILENPDIRIDELTVNNLWQAAFGKQSPKSRPIGNISFALNYYFHQYELAGYHIVNIVIHIINGILLWLFLAKTFSLKSVRPEIIRGEWIALLAAILWLVNPVQTQSVTYVVQRLNSLAAMFYLLSLLAYLNGRLTAGTKMRWAWLLGAALGWLLALGCKQNTATLPFFVLLYEWYFFQDLKVDWLKRNLRYLIIVFVVFIGVALLFLGTKPIDRLTSISDFANQEFTLAERVMTQFRVVIYYLSLIFFPHPSRLNLDYDFPLSVSLINPITTLLSLSGIIALVILAVLLAKNQRLISFSIFWFLGNLVIESSVIPLAIIFEHRLYLPSMLVGLSAVILFYQYLKPRWLPAVISCALILLCAYWTFERNKVWRDNSTLWADCVKKSPNKARPYSNLGVAQKLQNKTDEAVLNFRKALQLDPDFDSAHDNLGIILDDQGKTEEAIGHFRRAIEINPKFVKAHNNLGVALIKQDQPNEAVEHFLQALQIQPDFALSYSNLGLAYVKQGKIDEAVAAYLKALQLNPKLAETEFNLGDALLVQGKTEQAMVHLKKAVQLDPDHAGAHNNLGSQYLNQGRLEDALAHLTRALMINPDLAEAHNNIGIIKTQQGDLDAAITHFQDAVRIKPEFQLAQSNLQRALAIRDSISMEAESIQNALKSKPDDPKLHYQLGNFYLGKGALTKAIAEFESALALRPEFLAAQNNLALAYAADRRYDQALTAFKKLIELDPANAGAYYNIAVLYALQNKVPESLAWLKRAVDNGYQNWQLIKTDQDLANIRDSEDYKQLVKGH
jgi:tetratricopeptide (TPR) repeat protein